MCHLSNPYQRKVVFDLLLVCVFTSTRILLLNSQCEANYKGFCFGQTVGVNIWLTESTDL